MRPSIHESIIFFVYYTIEYTPDFTIVFVNEMEKYNNVCEILMN